MVAGYPKISHHLPQTMNKRETQTCTDNALPALSELGDAQASTGPRGRQELVSPVGSHCTSDHPAKMEDAESRVTVPKPSRERRGPPYVPTLKWVLASRAQTWGWGVKCRRRKGRPRTSSASGHRSPLYNQDKQNTCRVGQASRCCQKRAPPDRDL